MHIDKRDARFSTTAQIQPEQVEALAKEGYTLLVCARPDGEEAGQPPFSNIATAAERHGITAVHIPMTGAPSDEQVEALRTALAATTGPVLGYCRSGARAAKLYASLNA